MLSSLSMLPSVGANTTESNGPGLAAKRKKRRIYERVRLKQIASRVRPGVKRQVHGYGWGCN
jgi:hypothetical protein